jgi:hypothetical protein
LPIWLMGGWTGYVMVLIRGKGPQLSHQCCCSVR